MRFREIAASLVHEWRLTKLTGIGPHLAGVISELHLTGVWRTLDTLRQLTSW